VRLIAPFVFALGAVGCVHPEGVLRVVDGRVVEGAFVEPETYAAFLRGAIAEEAGTLPAALDAYREAARLDSRDAELWSRIARVRCAINPHDAASDEALTRAFAVDPSYAGAWSARAACALARGDTAGAEEAARRATVEEPLAVDLELLLARVGHNVSDEATRERLVALTLAYPRSAAAWEALAAWATTRGEIALYARAISELAVLAPTKRSKLAEVATSLAGDGLLTEALLVAGALADASSGDGLGAPSAFAHPLAARLAVDDAIARNDIELTRLRATRTHLGLDVAAARAALGGRDALARALAAEVVAADPDAVGARVVLAAVHGDVASAAQTRSSLELPAECALLLARAIADNISDQVAARVFAKMSRGVMVAGDPLVAPVAAALAARLVVPVGALSMDARVELCARRGETPAPDLIEAPSLDARHRYLALAIAEPTSSRTARLSEHLAAARATDTLVAVAWAREGMARGRAIDAHETTALLARAPGDPIALAAVLDVARKADDSATITRARTSLSALATTPAERARVTE
jgi:hypothetical protein